VRDGRIQWAWFSDAPLCEPFYELSARRARAAHAERPSTSLADLPSHAEAFPPARPHGLIFHLSRSGSSLTARMLAAGGDLVLAEPQPLDAVVREPRLSAEARVEFVRAMVRVLGAPAAAEPRLFLKLDCWHVLDLPLFRRAFPDTPWVFLYRGPIEVLVSHQEECGVQTVPQFFPPAFWGLEDVAPLPGPDWTARILAVMCEHAEAGLRLGGGRLVNYADLPGAVIDKVLPHFGVRPTPADRAAMAAATAPHAKRLSAFVPDTAARQAAAGTEIRAAAEGRLGEAYTRLEEIRRATAPLA
jgi:hypothetical protein